MDAVRLIKVTRDALAQCEEAADIVAEAWQAQALAEAVGRRLALAGPPEVRAAAAGLYEAGSRACGALEHPAQLAGGIRFTRLTEIRDPCGALRDLGGLLGESGAALVHVAAATEEEALYWQCMAAIDAADESGDRVAAILRRLALST